METIVSLQMHKTSSNIIVVLINERLFGIMLLDMRVFLINAFFMKSSSDVATDFILLSFIKHLHVELRDWRKLRMSMVDELLEVLSLFRI